MALGGTGFGSGVTVSQSIDYNFTNNGWSTTTSEGAYASFGPFNAGVNFSQTYDITNNQWNNGWGVSARTNKSYSKWALLFPNGSFAGYFHYNNGGMLLWVRR